MTNNPITVGINQIKISKSPQILQAIALGSCVAIILYDTKLKLGGLSHSMHPTQNKLKTHDHSPGKFVDTAISQMLNILHKKGVNPRNCNLVSKLVGGASMFNFNSDSALNIGKRNVKSARTTLQNANIPIYDFA